MQKEKVYYLIENIKYGLKRIDSYREDINKSIEDLKQVLDDRVRNEDGESAFPLERPKTCTPIVVESTWWDSYGIKQTNTFEKQYCPTEYIFGYTPTKEENEKMNIQFPNGYILTQEQIQEGLDNGTISYTLDLNKNI